MSPTRRHNDKLAIHFHEDFFLSSARITLDLGDLSCQEGDGKNDEMHMCRVVSNFLPASSIRCFALC